MSKSLPVGQAHRYYSGVEFFKCESCEEEKIYKSPIDKVCVKCYIKKKEED